jgi:hypothetical protein
VGSLRGVDNGDALGTTALAVLDSATTLGAGGTVLAGRAVRHLVIEVKVTIELDIELESGD